MPVIIRHSSIESSDSGTCHISPLLRPGNIQNYQVELDLISIPESMSHQIILDQTAVGWLQILSGSGVARDENLTQDHIAYLPLGFNDEFRATEGKTKILIARIPEARKFDKNIANMPKDLVSVDWTREPVLQSEHDERKRVYMATPTLAGTRAFKGEMITYPPGASAPEHHHVGAEHFQYVISGQGTAILDGKAVRLNVGDLLYNYEHEPHSFINDTDDDFVFVEFFVPGPCDTIWSPGANLCAWLPTGEDTEGRKPSRDIGYHVHGQDDGI